MKSECIELSLDLFIRLITSITELGELCSFGVWMFNVVCSHGAESGEESAKKGTEPISSPQPQGLSVKAESVTIWCPWKGHFRWRGVQTFEMLLLCVMQHLPAHPEQSSHFIPKWFPQNTRTSPGLCVCHREHHQPVPAGSGCIFLHGTLTTVDPTHVEQGNTVSRASRGLKRTSGKMAQNLSCISIFRQKTVLKEWIIVIRQGWVFSTLKPTFF